MSDKPKISIITVVYNGEQFLEETMQSVINQTYDNIEYIIIDGGSTDGTIDIIKKYEDKIDYWVSEEDKGIYDAMNKGINVATGDFVNFMNGGDAFYKSSILQIMSQQMNYDAVYFGRARNVGQNMTWLYPSNKFNIQNIKKWLTKELPNHQAMFFPKSFYKINKYDLLYKISGDADYKYKAKKLYKFRFIDEIICNFSIGGISSNFSSLIGVKAIMKDSWHVNIRHRSLFFCLRRQLMFLLKYLFASLKLKKFINK